ncbi:MAG: type toxin-antitoxin system RelE/ParE family toxin [Caulobacteraceae bacterium]|nr:type toxin-antitoxin system RelE/ParE family toxin [Caulobacteraceae bacterium]
MLKFSIRDAQAPDGGGDKCQPFAGPISVRFPERSQVPLRPERFARTAGKPPRGALRRSGGQHSIRVNDQFRLVFTWTNAGRADVEFVDYH